MGTKVRMSGLGHGLSIVAAIFGIVGIIPFLGWVNWLTTLPLAILAVIFSAVGLSRRQSTIATLGLIGGTIVLFWAMSRLTVGSGSI